MLLWLLKCAQVLARDMAERQVSPQILKELRTRRATVTPFYWGVKTILKVWPVVVWFCTELYLH